MATHQHGGGGVQEGDGGFDCSYDILLRAAAAVDHPKVLNLGSAKSVSDDFWLVGPAIIQGSGS
jgi:hypothetical protein